MRKIRSIIVGWFYLFFKKDRIEVMATHRALYCANCPNAKPMLFDIVLDDKLPQINGKYCQVCECPLSSKLRSPFEECPIGLWGEEEF